MNRDGPGPTPSAGHEAFTKPQVTGPDGIFGTHTWKCGHVSTTVAERNQHVLVDCPKRVAPKESMLEGIGAKSGPSLARQFRDTLERLDREDTL